MRKQYDHRTVKLASMANPANAVWDKAMTDNWLNSLSAQGWTVHTCVADMRGEPGVVNVFYLLEREAAPQLNIVDTSVAGPALRQPPDEP